MGNATCHENVNLRVCEAVCTNTCNEIDTKLHDDNEQEVTYNYHQNVIDDNNVGAINSGDIILCVMNSGNRIVS